MRLLRLAGPGLAMLAALVLAAPAQAAFPGRDGSLAVSPLRGAGVILVAANGRGAQRVCTSRVLCGRPMTPRFSPSGTALALTDAAGGHPVVVAGDGTCLWCLLGAPLTRLTGTAAVFTGDGRSVAVAGPGGLWRVPLAGGPARRLVSGTVAGSTWSAHGTVVYVSGGLIRVAARGRAARVLARGGQPDLSPDGRHLAFVRSGWIWLVATRGGRARRLVRGSSPVISPDGRHLAFIGHGGRVYVAGLRGRHPRLVPGVRGRALDWQAVPRRGPATCAVPRGATMIAQNAESVITTNPGHPFLPWLGCLRALGRRVPLASLSVAGSGYTENLQNVSLAGRYAAFVLAYSDRYGGCANTLYRVDLTTGRAAQLYALDCASSRRGVDSVGLDSSGFVTWRAFEQVLTPPRLTGVACPSSSECVAVDAVGNALSTTDPTGPAGAWTATKVAPGFDGIACPTASLCIGRSAGAIVTSTNPTGGAQAWSAPVTIDPGAALNAVACTPSATVCVAVDGAGNVLSSTNPTGPAAGWTVRGVDPAHALTGVACPRTSLCVAVGQSGAVFTTTNPAGGTWTAAQAGSALPLGGVACTSSPLLCVAADAAGNILTSSDPAAGTWTSQPVAGYGSLTDHLQCPSPSLCLGRAGGGLVVSTDPAGGGGTWTRTDAGSAGGLLDLSCPTGSLCLGVSAANTLVSSTDPAAAVSAWTPAAVETEPCGACVAEQLYVQDDRGRQAADTALPGPGNLIGGVALAGDSTVVTWTRAGAGRSFPLS